MKKSEKEIMRERRINGLGMTGIGLVVCYIFFGSLSAGYFNDLKHLNNQDEAAICCDDEESDAIALNGDSEIGERLFMANCSSCHLTHADANGPALTGARERWIKNSSEANFYDWIRNSKKVRNSGDPYANKLFKEWNGINMPAHNLTNEEIDEIFVYVN